MRTTKDPTNDPTTDPTIDPTSDPTNSPSDAPSQPPTNNPSKYPSSSPTQLPTLTPSQPPTLNPMYSPTLNPTYSPSNSPSNSPTKSPTRQSCVLNYDLDIAFLVDNSCGLTQDECSTQQESIAELLSMIKSYNNPRFMYITFSNHSIITNENILVSLDDLAYNNLFIGGESTAKLNFANLYNKIRDNNCGGNIIKSETHLNVAINYTLQEFMKHNDNIADRYYKMVIFSNCISTDSMNACDFYDNDILLSPERQVEVIIFNINNHNNAFNTGYLQCLSLNDDGQYYQYTDPYSILEASTS